MLKNRKKKRRRIGVAFDPLYVGPVRIARPTDSKADRKAGRRAVANHAAQAWQQGEPKRAAKRRRKKARKLQREARISGRLAPPVAIVDDPQAPAGL